MAEANRTSHDKLKRNHHLLLCLRPAVMENISRNCSSGSPFKHLRVKSLDTAVAPRILHSTASENDAVAAGHFKKKTSRRKFVRLIKAVLFETSLANKIKKKAKKKKRCLAIEDSPSTHETKDKYPITTATTNKKMGKKNQGKIISSTPSIESASTYSLSSCASSNASSSKRFQDYDFMSQTEQMNENGKESVRGYYGVNTGLFLLLVALLVSVIWGKLFAILCTSAWLFFVPNWRQGKNLLKSRLTSQCVDKEEYNKKIIMEGLLDRKRL